MKMRFYPCVVLAALTPLAIRAQTSTWTGSSSGSFNTATNWSSSAVPTSGSANLVFSATSNSNISISNALPFTANSITFNGTYPRYFFNDNGGTLTVGAGGITLDNTGTGSTSSTSNVDFNNSLLIALGASQTWTTNGTTNGNLTVSSNVSGGFALTKAGSGYLALNGNNTYTGGTTISAGALYLGQSSAAGTGAITVGSS